MTCQNCCRDDLVAALYPSGLLSDHNYRVNSAEYEHEDLGSANDASEADAVSIQPNSPSAVGDLSYINDQQLAECQADRADLTAEVGQIEPVDQDEHDGVACIKKKR